MTARAGAMRAVLEDFRRTRLYDLLAALPLMLWFGAAALQQRPLLAADLSALRAGAGLPVLLQFLAVAASITFDLLLVFLLAVREKPVRRSKGLGPRLCGFLGTFLSVAILYLPPARLSLVWQAVANLLIFGGGCGAILVLAKLGRAFSIMPEARLLVTGGVYRHVRHPLYTAEMFILAGIAIEFAQPWAGIIALASAALQVARSIFEERVLAEEYPEYAAYAARTRRFIPGIV